MTLEQLKQELDERYKFDIAKRSRTRKVSYARKVFCSLARNLDYTWESIGKTVGLSHEVAYYHYCSLDVIDDSDRIIYDDIISEYDLCVKPIYDRPIDVLKAKTEKEIKINIQDNIKQVITKMNEVMFDWDIESLNDFFSNRLTPYDKARKNRVMPKAIVQEKGAKINNRVLNPFLS